MKKRILSMLIVVCMVFAMFPSTAFATGDIAIGTNDVDNLVVCENHKEHESGKDGCGYIAAVEGTPCAHLNEDGSFSCTTEEDEDEATSSDAEYVCWHDDDCGFIEAAEGRSCKHECELCSTQAVPPVEDDSTLPPVNAPSEEQTRNETPCKDEAEGLDYLDEIAPEGTELTAEKQALLDAHLAICEVCDTIMNPPLMNLASVIDVADITALNNALKTDADTEIRLTANITGKASIPSEKAFDYTIDLNGFTLTTNSGSAATIVHNGTGTLTIKDDSLDGGGTIGSAQGRGVDNDGNGAVIISGGAVRTAVDHAVSNNSTGTVTVTGGTVHADGDSSCAIFNRSTGEVSVSSGTVSATKTTGTAIYNASTGEVTISGDAVVTSANARVDGGTIVIANGTADDTALTIKDNATVKNTSTATGSNECNAIYNGGVGTIDVSGGTVSATGGKGVAIYNKSTGLVKVSGNALITSEGSSDVGTIFLDGGTAIDEVLVITGGTVEITGNGNGYAIRNAAEGIINVSGGTVQATGSCSAINSSNGTLNVSGTGTKITATSTSAINNNYGTVNVSGGVISSTSNAAISITGAGTVNVSGGEISSGNSLGIDNDRGTVNVRGAAIIKGGNKAMITAPTLIGVTAKASTNYDGNPLGDYDPAVIANYKYIEFAPAVVPNKVSNITKNTNHPTITAAIAAADSGDTLQLLEDINEAVTIASGDSKSYTLDLNGFTLDGGNTTTISYIGTGTLTIKDSGSDGKVKGSSVTTIGNTGAGTVTISGGTVENTGAGHAILNYTTGTVNVSGGTVQSTINVTILNSNGTVNVSGGMIFSTDNIAIFGGATNVSGSAIMKGGTQAITTAPTLTTGVTAKASTNFDGSSPVDYDPADIANYKYIKFATSTPGTIVLNGTVSGVVGTPLPASTTITATLSGDTFHAADLENTPITSMFTNIPAGITATASNVTDTTALVTFTGTPTAVASGKVTAYVPAKISVGSTNLIVLNNGIDIPSGNISGGSWSITTGGGSVTPPSPPSGGGGGGGGSSSNTTPPATKPTEPVSGNTENKATVDDKGNANVTLTDKNIQDAIADANAEAAKKGVTAGDITAVIHVTTGGMDASTVTVNLPKTTQEQVIGGKIAKVELVIDRPDLTIGMNLAAITEINKQANADVQITATKTDASKRSEEANNAIGSRPAYDLKATYGGDGKSVTNFGTGMVSIEIPYKLQDGEAAGGVAAVYVDGAGKITYLQSSGYDAKRETLVFSTNHFSVYGVGYKTPMAYTDIGTHWAKTDIEFVVDRGLMSGTSATTFAPDDTMTRGMFATALGRLAGADVSSYKQSSFSDVNADSYYLGYIEWANKYGIMTSASEGKFAPDSPVTREQMAVVMERYTTVLGFKLPTVHVANTFADNAKISSVAAPAVKRVQMAGIITGKTNNVFDPQGTATRAEVSAVFKRFVELAIFSDTAQGFKMNDSGKWMYYENGKAVTGTKTIGGTTYNFNSYGETSDVPNN